MPFTKAVQAAGDWSIRLRPDTPAAITRAAGVLAAGFGSLIVTPAHLPAELVTLDQSIYTGVLRTQNDRLELGGAHATIWLGDEDGKADIGGAISKTLGTLSAWVTDIVAPTPLTVGTVTGSGFRTWTWGGALGEERSPREALDYITTSFGVEWRVNDDLKVDVASRAALYGAAGVVASRRWSGRDLDYRAVRATMSLSEDLEDYTTRAIVVWDNDGTKANVWADAPATTFLDPNGVPVVWDRMIESEDSKSSTQAQTIANREATRFSTVRQNVTLKTEHRAILHDLRCGEQAWLWDPEQGVLDVANQIQFRGHVLCPLLSRIVSITMPAERGLGIYLRRGTDEPIDLTPWVEWEAPGAEVELGAFAPSIAKAMQRRGLRKSA